jgi:hypothetical protein
VQRNSLDNNIELIYVRVDAREDRSVQYNGTLNVSFPDDESAVSFHIRVPLPPTVEEVGRWEKLVWLYSGFGAHCPGFTS